MKGRIQMIHGDQDRDLGSEDQRGQDGKDEDEARTR